MLICIENVLEPQQARQMREQLAAASWEDGVKTAGAVARLAKHNRQLDESGALAVALGNQILARLGNHPQFVSAALPARIYPPRFNRYDAGDTFGLHVDAALMRLPGSADVLRSDLSATLFLSAPDEYDGGELQVEGDFGVQSVKLDAGDMVLYPASSLHQVTPVTAGTRYASFLWVESFVHDPSVRTALYDMDQAIQALGARLGAGDEGVLKLTHAYTNLLRRHART